MNKKISPHTQLGRGKSYNGWYPKAREWGYEGVIKDIDFTNHGWPQVDPIPKNIHWRIDQISWVLVGEGILYKFLKLLKKKN